MQLLQAQTQPEPRLRRRIEAALGLLQELQGARLPAQLAEDGRLGDQQAPDLSPAGVQGQRTIEARQRVAEALLVDAQSRLELQHARLHLRDHGGRRFRGVVGPVEESVVVGIRRQGAQDRDGGLLVESGGVHLVGEDLVHRQACLPGELCAAQSLFQAHFLEQAREIGKNIRHERTLPRRT